MRSRPARRAAAEMMSFTAAGGTGAPAGSRNKLTSTKSETRRRQHRQPLELVRVERLHRHEVQRHGALPP